MAEQEHVALGDAVADLLLPDVAVELVGQQDHHEVAAAGRLDDRQHLEALLARRRDRGRVLAQADDDVDAGVLEVERVGVALGAVADDGDGLAVEELEVCVVVVDHWRAGYPNRGACRPSGARRTRRACGRASRARRPARCRARSARCQRAVDLARSRPAGARARRRGSCARGRASPPTGPRSSRGGARSSTASTRISVEAGLARAARARARRRPARTAPARGSAARPAAARGRARAAPAPGSSAHGLRLDRVPDRERHAPAGAQHAPRLAPARRAGSAISM